MQEMLAQWRSGASIEFNNTNAKIAYNQKTKRITDAVQLKTPDRFPVSANFIHCPFRVTRMDRPFILIQSQYAPKHTETSLRYLVDKDKLDRTIMINEDGT